MMKKLSVLVLAALQFGCGGGGGGSSSAPAPAPAPVVAPVVMPVLASSTTLIGPAGTTPTWSDRSTATGGSGKTIGAVECLTDESYHLHTHLTILVDGVTQRVPKEVGLTGCAYETHTHDYSGVIHVETSVQKKFTLGQFFAVWGQPLTRTNVAGLSSASIRTFIADGAKLTETTDDPATIELLGHRSIYIVIGSVPATLPSHEWPAGL